MSTHCSDSVLVVSLAIIEPLCIIAPMDKYGDDMVTACPTTAPQIPMHNLTPLLLVGALKTLSLAGSSGVGRDDKAQAGGTYRSEPGDGCRSSFRSPRSPSAVCTNDHFTRRGRGEGEYNMLQVVRKGEQKDDDYSQADENSERTRLTLRRRGYPGKYCPYPFTYRLSLDIPCTSPTAPRSSLSLALSCPAFRDPLDTHPLLPPLKKPPSVNDGKKPKTKSPRCSLGRNNK